MITQRKPSGAESRIEAEDESRSGGLDKDYAQIEL